MSELLPCPFDDHPAQVIGPVLRSDGGEVYIGYCARCGCRGPYAYNEHDAAALWNRRAAPAAPNVDRLVEALYHLVSFGEFKDIELLHAYRTAYKANATAGKIARDHRIPYLAGFRALVLAALATPEPPLHDPISHALLQNPD